MLIGELEQLKDPYAIRFLIKMPVTYVRGVKRQITKNNITTVNMNRSGFHMRRNRDLVNWYEFLEVLGSSIECGRIICPWKNDIERKYGQDKWIIEMKIYWYLLSKRTDCHNYNMILLDGIQKFIGINDRKIYPNVVGMKKIEKKDLYPETYARIIMVGKKNDGEMEKSFMEEYEDIE